VWNTGEAIGKDPVNERDSQAPAKSAYPERACTSNIMLGCWDLGPLSSDNTLT
jgi:hypothetical protein